VTSITDVQISKNLDAASKIVWKNFSKTLMFFAFTLFSFLFLFPRYVQETVKTENEKENKKRS